MPRIVIYNGPGGVAGGGVALDRGRAVVMSESQYESLPQEVLDLSTVVDLPDTVSDVTADDATTIQAAIDRAATGVSRVVQLVAGRTYDIAASLRIKTGVTLDLNGATLRATAALNAHVITNDDLVAGNDDWAVVNGTIDGNRAGQSAGNWCGVYAERCNNYRLHNLRVKDARGKGIYLLGSSDVDTDLEPWRYLSLLNIRADGCASDGVYVGNGQRAVQAIGITAHDNDGHGVVIDHSESAYTNIHAYMNAQRGIWIRNVFDVNLAQLRATLNGQHGIYVERYTDGAASAWQAFENGTSGAGYSDVYLGAETGGYGITDGIEVDGIRCGPLMNNARNWKPLPASGPTPEDYGLYIADGVEVAEKIRLRNVVVSRGTLGAVRVPANLGGIELDLGRSTRRKLADESRASTTTLAADTELGVFSIKPGETWLVEYEFRVDSASDTPDLKVQVTAPSGATGWWSAVGHGTAASGTGAQATRMNALNFGDVQTLGGVSTGVIIKVAVIVTNGSNAGDVGLLWAQNTSDAGNVTVKAGSLRRAERLP